MLTASDAPLSPSAPAGGSARISFTAATGDAAIDGLLAGTYWLGTPSFGFPAASGDFGPDYGGPAPDSGFAQASPGQMQAVREILTGNAPDTGGPVMRYGSVASFTLLHPGEAQDAATADLRYAQSADPVTAYTYVPWASAGDGSEAGPSAGDVWFGRNYAPIASPQLGDYGWAVILHETGHALGLKHAQEAGGPAGIGVPTEFDSLEYTAMSYRSVPNGIPGVWTNEGAGYPQTYMTLDIAALQHLYGANFDTNSGDTTYGWSPDTGEMFINGVGQGAPAGNRIFLTIWDGGGNDTYDLSNYGNAVSIDLQPGHSSVTSPGQLALLDAAQGIRAAGNVHNALLFEGDPRSLLENAIGGSGNDSITGNAAGNRLVGNGGNDTLLGLDGDDALAGGPGDDYLDGGPGADSYIFHLSSMLVAGSGAPGTLWHGFANAPQDLQAGVAGMLPSGVGWQLAALLASHGHGRVAAPAQEQIQAEGNDTIAHLDDGDVLQFDLPQAMIEPHVSLLVEDADHDGIADTGLHFDGGGGITLLDVQYASLEQLAGSGHLRFAQDAALIA